MEPYSIFNEVKKFFKSSDAVTQLVAVNIAVFALYHIVHLFFLLFAAEDSFFLYSWLAAPTDLSSLSARPWTVFTYMFFHKDLLHLLFNMLWLFWFGRILCSFFERQYLIGVFILGGLAGVFLYILSYNLFPAFSSAKYFSSVIGASAGVLAIVTAISCYVPEYRISLLFIGRVRLIYIAMASVLLDIVSISMSDNIGGHIAHLGGAGFGCLFAFNMRNRRDIVQWLIDGWRRCEKPFRRKSKLKVNYRKPPADDWEYNRQKKEHQAEIDRILDKISLHGYDTLTSQEKEFLFGKK
ncbi:MAG: rhomboid family intramembrane serine protease [Bacteroidales bacterium]|jgi:membrane associated rhomboid family serine protease|nr:rhomboid family intramembrane serine protease [Bacteroidales bacterium]